MHSCSSTRLKILMHFTHRYLYSRVITPGASGKRGWMGPRACMDDLEKKVFFFSVIRNRTLIYRFSSPWSALYKYILRHAIMVYDSANL
jgi:hypothetical protein